MVAGPGAGAGGLDAGRHIHRRDADPRHAQHDGDQSAVIYVIAAAVLIPLFGNHGLWLALLICYVARGVTLWARYPALEAAVGR